VLEGLPRRARRPQPGTRPRPLHGAVGGGQAPGDGDRGRRGVAAVAVAVLPLLPVQRQRLLGRWGRRRRRRRRGILVAARRPTREVGLQSFAAAPLRDRHRVNGGSTWRLRIGSPPSLPWSRYSRCSSPPSPTQRPNESPARTSRWLSRTRR